MSTTRSQRKTFEGMVVSDKAEKTITVKVTRREKHPVFSKIVTRSVKLRAHDENNEAGVGDRVLVMETRPLSKNKCWRLVKIQEKAK